MRLYGKSIFIMEIAHTVQEAFPRSEKKSAPLYPERASENIDALLDRIQSLESGETEKIPLSEEEREKILGFENSLGNALEKIFDITPQTASFHIGYLLTSEGRSGFEKAFGIRIDESSDVQEIKRFLIENRSSISAATANVRSRFLGEVRGYADENILQELSETMGADGEINIDAARNPESVSVLLTPEKSHAKITGLREFKKQLKEFRAQLSADESLNPHEKEATMGILDLYQRRTNEMLTEQFSSAATIKEEASIVGEDRLSPEEKSILDLFSGLGSQEKNASRLDKFIHGAGNSYTDSGWREQVSEDLDRFARETGDTYIASVLGKEAAIRSMGLDEKKISEKSISWKEFERMGNETLAAYGILSEIPPEEYDSSRSGTAQDGKWQFVCRDEYKSFSVDGKRKALKTGRKPLSIGTAIPLLAHEIEGHALQHENKSKIPLRLFERVGGGRWQVFAECGAMQNQDTVSKEAFGFETVPHPHYVRAMKRRLSGGNYLECVKVFHESALEEIRLKKKLGRIDDETFMKESGEKLSLAINRVRRLFSGSSLQSSSDFLTNSKDTVYIEQVKLYQKLDERGLKKYAFIGSANLKTITFLLESGFLDPKMIRQPQFHSLKIWEGMKDKYRSEN